MMVSSGFLKMSIQNFDREADTIQLLRLLEK